VVEVWREIEPLPLLPSPSKPAVRSISALATTKQSGFDTHKSARIDYRSR